MEANGGGVRIIVHPQPGLPRPNRHLDTIITIERAPSCTLVHPRPQIPQQKAAYQRLTATEGAISCTFDPDYRNKKAAYQTLTAIEGAQSCTLERLITLFGHS